MKLAKIVKHCRIDKPGKFKLADFDPAETFGLATDIEQVRAILADGVARLEDMQERLYAHGRWAVLIVLQGMDAAGKDGVIKHVMAGVNPQGCTVHAFKAPSAEELAHISSGASISIYRSAGGSASSTARTMKRCWRYGCIPISSNGKSCRRA